MVEPGRAGRSFTGLIRFGRPVHGGSAIARETKPAERISYNWKSRPESFVVMVGLARIERATLEL